MCPIPELAKLMRLSLPACSSSVMPCRSTWMLSNTLPRSLLYYLETQQQQHSKLNKHKLLRSFSCNLKVPIFDSSAAHGWGLWCVSFLCMQACSNPPMLPHALLPSSDLRSLAWQVPLLCLCVPMQCVEFAWPWVGCLEVRTLKTEGLKNICAWTIRKPGRSKNSLLDAEDSVKQVEFHQTRIWGCFKFGKVNVG